MTVSLLTLTLLLYMRTDEGKVMVDKFKPAILGLLGLSTLIGAIVFATTTDYEALVIVLTGIASILIVLREDQKKQTIDSGSSNHLADDHSDGSEKLYSSESPRTDCGRK